jgi:cyclic pyranopterin phosphate synthase
MTTNGLRLRTLAGELAAAGLARVNVSLDTLDPDRFERIAGFKGLEDVRDGIEAARQYGLTPIRLNTVVMRGENDDELPDLVRYAAGISAEIRFIELMPMGPLAGAWRSRFVSAEEMRSRLAPAVRSWHTRAGSSDSATRHLLRLKGGGSVEMGLISPMSHPFCRSCDRIRIAADGSFYPCLMDEPRGSVLPALRPRFDPDGVDAVLTAGLREKAPSHPAAGCDLMTHIGG